MAFFSIFELQVLVFSMQKYVSVPVYEMDQFPADLVDTQKSLSFHPKVSIEEGTKIFSKWFLENQGRKP